MNYRIVFPGTSGSDASVPFEATDDGEAIPRAHGMFPNAEYALLEHLKTGGLRLVAVQSPGQGTGEKG